MASCLRLSSGEQLGVGGDLRDAPASRDSGVSNWGQSRQSGSFLLSAARPPRVVSRNSGSSTLSGHLRAHPPTRTHPHWVAAFDPPGIKPWRLGSQRLVNVYHCSVLTSTVLRGGQRGSQQPACEGRPPTEDQAEPPAGGAPPCDPSANWVLATASRPLLTPTGILSRRSRVTAESQTLLLSLIRPGHIPMIKLLGQSEEQKGGD